MLTDTINLPDYTNLTRADLSTLVTVNQLFSDMVGARPSRTPWRPCRDFRTRLPGHPLHGVH